MEQLEAPKVLWGSRSLRVGDVLRGLHIQEQGRYSGERNHLTTCLDLHKDHLGPGGSVAHLGLGGELKVEIGLGPRGGLYVRSFIGEAQSHHGRVRIVQGLGAIKMAKAVKGSSVDEPSTR